MDFVGVMQQEADTTVGWPQLETDLLHLGRMCKAHSADVSYDQLEQTVMHVRAFKDAEISSGSPMLVALWRSESSKKLIDFADANLLRRSKEKEAASTIASATTIVDGVLGAEDMFGDTWAADDAKFEDLVAQCTRALDTITEGLRRFKDATTVVAQLRAQQSRIQSSALNNFSKFASAVLDKAFKHSAQAGALKASAQVLLQLFLSR